MLQRRVWVLGLICWIPLALLGQPLYVPPIQNSAIQFEFQKPLPFDGRSDPATARAIWDHIVNTRDDPRPEVHWLLCLKEAEVLIRQRHLGAATRCLRYVRGHLPRMGQPAQQADLWMLYGDLACETEDPALRAQAMRLYDRALALLPPGTAGRGTVERKRGMVFRLHHQPDSALACYDRSYRLLKEGPLRERLRTFQERGVLFFKTADENPALVRRMQAEFDSAEAIIKPHPGTYYMEDMVLQHYYLGRICTAFLHNADSAKYHYYRAIAIRRADEVYSAYLPYCYNSLGVIMFNDGDYSDAKEIYEEELDLLSAYSTNHERKVRVRKQLADVAIKLGDPLEGLRHFKLALDEAEQAGIGDKLDPDILLSYGIALMNVFNHAHASEIMLDALGRYNSAEKSDYSSIATCHFNIGQCDYASGLWGKARNNFIDARDNYRLAGNLDEGGMALTFAYLASSSVRAGDSANGALYLDTAMACIRRSASTSADVTEAAIPVGEYLQGLGRYEEALALYHREFKRQVYGFNTPDVLAVPNFNNARAPWHILEIARGKAAVLWKLYLANRDARYLQGAIRLYAEAIRLIRKNRLERGQQDSKLQMSDEYRSLFEGALAVTNHLARNGVVAAKDSAFRICEQSKAMVLLEAVVQSKAESALIPRERLAEKELLEERIANDRTRLFQTRDPAEQSAIQARIARRQTELDALLTSLRIAYPSYYDRLYREGYESIADVRAYVRREGIGLIEYFLTDTLLYTFVVSPDTFLMLAQPVGQGFHCDLEDHHQAVADARAEYQNDQYACSHRLYKTLVASIPVDLPEQVVIIPDGKLNYLAFEALVSDMPDTIMDMAQLRFLLDDHVISYNYSAAFLLQAERRADSARATIAGFAPRFGPEHNLEMLRGARKSIQNLHNSMAGFQLYLDDAATETQFKRLFQPEAGPHPDIVDLATHAILDTFPLRSHLHFAKTMQDDGILYLHELYAMHMDTRLAILEACESGDGTYSRGEGVMSLARGFTYAGCKSVLMSLWEVSDGASTLDIMAGFFEGLSKNKRVNIALAHAKRAYLARLRESGSDRKKYSPFNWAEFVLVGDFAPIPVESIPHPPLWPAWSLALVGLVGMAWVVFTSRA